LGQPKNYLSTELIWRIVCLFSIILIISIFIIFIVSLTLGSTKSIFEYGLSFLTSISWNPVFNRFGALPFVYGTLLTSILALILAFPISLGVAIASSELLPKKISLILDPVVELMAAIPSIVYGMWALFILAPFIREVLGPNLKRYLGDTPLFQGPLTGYGYLTASIILFIMILPIISSLSREALKAVPREITETALAIGATRWEAIRIKIGVAKIGIFGAVILGFARALGETMAVLLVIGNKPIISTSLLSSGATIASVLANEYPEAISDPLYLSALNELALILLGLSLILNIIFLRIMKRHIGGKL